MKTNSVIRQEQDKLCYKLVGLMWFFCTSLRPTYNYNILILFLQSTIKALSMPHLYVMKSPAKLIRTGICTCAYVRCHNQHLQLHVFINTCLCIQWRNL